MVESFQANAHGARSLAEANQTDTFDDTVTGLCHDGEPDDDQGRCFCLFSAGNAISSCGYRSFGDNAIDVFGDPSPDLLDGTDSGDDFTTDESETLYRFPRFGKLGSRSRLRIEELCCA